MRKFANYPIMVNYNLHTFLRNKDKEKTLHDAGKLQQEKDLFMKVTTTSDTTLKNFIWKQELEKFEAAVFGQLKTICANPVGRKVLDLINKRTTVWIIPKWDDPLGPCNCDMTSPLNYDIPKDGDYTPGAGSGDTVIQFKLALDDDVLFHELVHAYRYSCKKYNDWDIFVDDQGSVFVQNVEEFFAHEMENIYRSQIGGKLTKEYRLQELSNKEDIYNFLAVNLEMITALKEFLRHDTLASIAARCFPTDYNSFRDAAEIEQRYWQYKKAVGQ